MASCYSTVISVCVHCTYLDLLAVEVGDTDGLDEPLLDELLHGQPGGGGVGVVEPEHKNHLECYQIQARFVSRWSTV